MTQAHPAGLHSRGRNTLLFKGSLASLAIAQIFHCWQVLLGKVVTVTTNVTKPRALGNLRQKTGEVNNTTRRSRNVLEVNWHRPSGSVLRQG
jgi:hypothetical protein